MTTRHEIPGGWVELRAQEDVREKHARRVRAIAMRASNLPGMGDAVAAGLAGDTSDLKAKIDANEEQLLAAIGSNIVIFDEMQDASIMARLKAWSFCDEDDVPLPIAEASLQELKSTSYAALQELCKDLPTGPDLAASPDPKADTSSSTD